MSTIKEAFIDIVRKMSLDQRDWQRTIGFGEEGDMLRAINADVHRKWDGLARDKSEITAHVNIDAADSALRNYYIAKLALIMTEVAEAIEELRNNRGITEVYYSGGLSGHDALDPSAALDIEGAQRKPEGVPSELADIVIRCLSLAGEINLDLGAAIFEKLEYNETRARKHGGKAI